MARRSHMRLLKFSGGIAGPLITHLMFGLSLISLSHHVRSGPTQIFGAFVATLGLLSVIWGCVRSRPGAAAFAVGSYIAGAYWFTASTSFANPAVTIARTLTDTFAGIKPSDAPYFILVQIAGAGAATVLFRWLAPSLPTVAKNVVARETER